MKFASLSLLLGLAAASCTGDVKIGTDLDPVCDNEPPATPAVASPDGARGFGLVPEQIGFASSAYSDPEGVEPASADWEIWTESGGQLGTHVWSATVVDPAATVRVEDGEFDAGFDALSQWSDYAVRVRHRDKGTPCNRVSAWSAPVTFRTDDGSVGLFDEWTVRDIHIEMTPEVKASLDAQAIPPGCVPYERDFFPGNVVIDGVRFDGVGIKTKGGCGSAETVDNKASFKINLNWDDPAVPGCPGGREFRGQKKLTLNNQVQDPSASHERLSYYLYRVLGAGGPRVAPVRVFVNDELFGLYLNVESIERRYLAQRYPSNGGMIYEGTYYCDLTPDHVRPEGDTSDNPVYCLTPEFSPDACDSPDPDDDPQDYSLIRDLVDVIEDIPAASFYADIQQVFDWDQVLTLWAADALVNNWDGFVLREPNNYRVYHEPTTDRWKVINTGVDQNFQTSRDENAFASGNVLGRRCLADLACKAAYAAKLREVRDRFVELDLKTYANKIHQQVGPLIREGRRVDETGFNNVHADTLQFIDIRPGRIDQYLVENGF